MDFKTDLRGFEITEELSVPYRWYQEGNNRELGDSLKKLRDSWIEDGKEYIDFSKYKSYEISFIEAPEADLYIPRSYYGRCLNRLIRNPDKKPEFDSLLIIVPEYAVDGRKKGMIMERASIKSRVDFTNQLTLLEAIDDKSYYTISKNIDDLVLNINRKRKPIKAITDNVLLKLFNKTEIGKWIKDNRVIDKTKENKVLSLRLKQMLDKFIEYPSTNTFSEILNFLKTRLKLKTKRNDLFRSVLKALNTSVNFKVTVYDAMVNHKNIVRRAGRKIYGKCIGTTLLTKGLEFDTVVILNAHRFSCPKHFYVAITRASKRLVVFSEKQIIEF